MTNCIDHGRKGNARGYATGRLEGKCAGLHQITYCKTHGLTLDDLKGKSILHSCDNPRCIQPAHLSLGTQRDNILDMHSKGRAFRKPIVDRELAALMLSEGATQISVASHFGVSRAALRHV